MGSLVAIVFAGTLGRLHAYPGGAGGTSRQGFRLVDGGAELRSAALAALLFAVIPF